MCKFGTGFYMYSYPAASIIPQQEIKGQCYGLGCYEFWFYLSKTSEHMKTNGYEILR